MASPDPISLPQSTINELIDHPTVDNVRDIIGMLRISRAESESDSILFTTRCKWVVRHTARNDELQRKLINTVICTITGAQEARRGQIDAVQRLVYTKGDTILVAATGYGKSAVLHAFTAITGLQTIQIVPLSRLGSSQAESIRVSVPGSNPIFIDADTHLKVCPEPLSP